MSSASSSTRGRHSHHHHRPHHQHRSHHQPSSNTQPPQPPEEIEMDLHNQPHADVTIPVDSGSSATTGRAASGSNSRINSTDAAATATTTSSSSSSSSVMARPPNEEIVFHSTYISDSDTEGPAVVGSVFHGTYLAPVAQLEEEAITEVDLEDPAVPQSDPFLSSEEVPPPPDPLIPKLRRCRMMTALCLLAALGLLALVGLLLPMYLTVPPPATWTPTRTPSRTASMTRSLTRTMTLAPTNTSSLTITADLTLTSTSTRTRVFTPTPTRTLAATRSATPTRQRSPTITATTTFTPTATATPTLIPTRTRTSSSTHTVTVVPTHTATASPTRSETQTPFPTATPLPTRTFTPTATFTRTRNSTAAHTLTPSQTHTATLTPLPTRSRTWTYTRTHTNTPTRSVTLSASVTTIRTASYTRTRTMTGSPTGSLTPTVSQTPTCPMGPDATELFPSCQSPDASVPFSLAPGDTCGLCSVHQFETGDSCQQLRQRSDFIPMKIDITNQDKCNMPCEKSRPTVGDRLSMCIRCLVVALPAGPSACDSLAMQFGVSASDIYNADDGDMLCASSRQLEGDRQKVCRIPVPIERCQGLPSYTVQSGDTCASIASTQGVSQAFLLALNPGLQCQMGRIPANMVLCLPCTYTGPASPTSTVYLAFAGGPQYSTPDIFNILSSYSVPGTFFVSGNNLALDTVPNATLNAMTLKTILDGNSFIADNSYSAFPGTTPTTCSYSSIPATVTDYNNNWSIVGQALTPLELLTTTVTALMPAFAKSKRIPCFNTWRLKTSGGINFTYDCATCGNTASRQIAMTLANYFAAANANVLGWTMEYCPLTSGYNATSGTCGGLSGQTPKQTVCQLIDGLESGSLAPLYNGIRQRILLMYDAAFNNQMYEGRQNLIQLGHLVHLLQLRGHSFDTINRMGVPQ